MVCHPSIAQNPPPHNAWNRSFPHRDVSKEGECPDDDSRGAAGGDIVQHSGAVRRGPGAAAPGQRRAGKQRPGRGADAGDPAYPGISRGAAGADPGLCCPAVRDQPAGAVPQ